MVERKYRCPECGAGPRIIVEKHDGALACLTCNCVFRIDGRVPKLYVKSLRPAKYLGERARAFIDLMRPVTLIAAGVAGFSLVLLFSGYQGLPFDFLLAFGCGISLAFLQSAGQAFNQSLEEEIAIDRAAQKVYRPTVQGIITPSEGKLFSALLFTIGISLAFMLKTWFGFFAVVIAFFAFFYTSPPLRVKKRFLANNIWQGVSRGFLPVIAVAYGIFVLADVFPIFLGGVIALWCVGGQETKNFGIQEEKADRRFGVRNLVVVLGRRRTIWVMAGFMSASFALMLGAIYFDFLPLSFVWLLLLIIPTYFILSNLNPPRQVGIAENNLSWVLFYSGLGLWYILPSIVIFL